ncbi:hypothetical protein RBG61_11680 [Paludicola sp. MB14-C6]|uniref:hypothetical protein n=1 Tax=Paludihabitans sp. MB14-C6 TaxID=3070656 RepID=UPI0027DD195A|nr:hypothetical protein [Paludicola sp. MB14-C6]WMJ22642.1 hypothetical protein RBG61_11680 [Paludicola sp. MB14-C6]
MPVFASNSNLNVDLWGNGNTTFVQSGHNTDRTSVAKINLYTGRSSRFYVASRDNSGDWTGWTNYIMPGQTGRMRYSHGIPPTNQELKLNGQVQNVTSTNPNFTGWVDFG